MSETGVFSTLDNIRSGLNNLQFNISARGKQCLTLQNVRSGMCLEDMRAGLSSKRCLLLLIFLTIPGVMLYARQLNSNDMFILSRTDSGSLRESNDYEEKATSPSLLKAVNKEFDLNFKKVEGMMSTRMKKISAYCNATHKNYNLHNAYSFPELNILWVPSFKAGSSTWRDYFIQTIKEGNSTNDNQSTYKLTDLEERHLFSRNYRGKTRTLKKESGVRKDVVSFMQVRHPIDRLISLHLSTARLKSDIGSMKVWGMEAIIESRLKEVPRNKTKLYKQELEAWTAERSKKGIEGLSETVDEDFIERAQPS